MLPQPEGERLLKELTAASIAGDTLPREEIIVDGPGGSTRKILSWEDLGTASIIDTYPDGSYRSICFPVEDDPHPGGRAAIVTTIGSESVSIGLPVFPQASRQDVRLRLHDATNIGDDSAAVTYDSVTGQFTRASILVASSESTKDDERAGEELNVDQRFSLLLNKLLDLSPSQRAEIKDMSGNDFNQSTENIDGLEDISYEVDIVQEQIVPAVIKTIIQRITTDKDEQERYMQLLQEVDFAYVFTGNLLYALETKERIIKLVTFWEEGHLTQNVEQTLLELLEDIAIAMKDHDMRAELTKMDPMQKRQLQKAKFLAEHVTDIFADAVDFVMLSYKMCNIAVEEQRIALEVNQQGSLTYQVYSLSTIGPQEERTDRENGLLHEGTTTITVMDQDVEIEVQDQTIIVRWIPRNRRGERKPTKTARFQKQISLQEILKGATDVNAPVPEVIALLGASISNS